MFNGSKLPLYKLPVIISVGGVVLDHFCHDGWGEACSKGVNEVYDLASCIYAYHPPVCVVPQRQSLDKVRLLTVSCTPQLGSPIQS